MLSPPKGQRAKLVATKPAFCGWKSNAKVRCKGNNLWFSRPTVEMFRTWILTRPMFKANPNLLFGGEPQLNVQPKWSQIVYDQSRLYGGRLLGFPKYSNHNFFF